MPVPTVILASQSPRRRELLGAAGIPCVVEAMDVDETRRADEDARAYARRVARLKADAGARRHPDAIVLAADTVVIVDDTVFGKPASDADAVAMLERLSGRVHVVLTAVAAVFGDRVIERAEETSVWMRPLSVGQIRDYVATGEPDGKAGAYAIQGVASRFVTRIEGSYTNVVGLPVATVDEILRELGGDG